MEDKWYSLRCRIALAKELGVAPDELDVSPVLEMVEGACFRDNHGEYELNIMPDDKEQEDAIMNNYYHIVLDRIMNSQAPFCGFLENIMSERGFI